MQESPPLATRWRFVLTPPLAGAHNMAVDVALMQRARRTGEAVFRVYTWAVPTLSFGRNQTALGRYDIDRIRALGIETVRRPTGGRAILHRREITYSVTAPAHDAVGLRQSYARINMILLHGLRRLCVPVDLATSTGRALLPTDAPCFVQPSDGEMTTNGRKLVGSAQWRDEGALLQHGSILVDDDQETIASLMHAPPQRYTPVGTLRDALGHAPTVTDMAHAMLAALRETDDPHADLLEADDVVHQGETCLPQFLDDQWTWRR